MSRCNPSHKLPSFPLLCRVWRPETLITDDPDIDDLKCQLVFPVGVLGTQDFADPNRPQFLYLYVPKGTDLRCSINWTGPDRIECPKLSGRTYAVVQVDDIAKGFPNEFRCAILEQITALGLWDTPIP